MSTVVVKKAKWGEFPVLHYRGVRQDGRVASAAWVGLNTPDHFTLFFDFKIRSSEGKMPAEDEAIWEKFLAATK